MPQPNEDFVGAVLEVVASIPEGRAMSYGDVAAAIGSSGHPPQCHEGRALEFYRAEGTPLVWSRDGHVFRVDLARARHAPD